MFCDCLYSVNKRAKNFRDKAQSYHYNPYYRGYYQEEDMDRYYGYKDQFLNLLTPVCIHKQNVGYETRRVYDYEKDYHKMNNRTLSGKIVTMTVTKTEKSGSMTMKPKPKDISISYITLLAQKFPQAYSWTIRYDLPIKPIDDDFIDLWSRTPKTLSHHNLFSKF